MKEKKLKQKSKIKTLASDHKAITLIALVITIIIMLILVGVTVSIAINGGLFSTAKKAVAETQAATDEEQLYSAVLGLTDANTGKVDLEKLQEQLSDWQIDQETGKCISPKGNEFMVADYGNIKALEYAKATEIFDANGKDENADGYDPNKLHIGDFINYDAGTWTKDEIDAIQVGPKENPVSANNSQSLPNAAWKFGGFQAGDSRNGNATPSNYNSTSTSYNYIKDSNGKAITGWRLFDIKDDGSMVLISAGCPEDYYHGYDSSLSNCGEVSEFILSGEPSSLENNYIKRNWNNYINNKQKAIDAYPLNESELSSWYKKYYDYNGSLYNIIDDIDGIKPTCSYQMVIGSRFESLILNYSYFWTCKAEQKIIMRLFVPQGVSGMNGGTPATAGYALGVRILVTLSSDAKLSKEIAGTKTVVDPRNADNSWTYNVWNIK